MSSNYVSIVVNGGTYQVHQKYKDLFIDRVPAIPGIDTVATQAELDEVLTQLVPSGGATGQALVKLSATDFDTEWAAVAGGSSLVFNVVDYGADPTGATDSTSSVLAADAACETAGGGTVFFPAGVFRCDSQLTLSNDAASPVPKFKARRWAGSGAWMSGKTVNSAPNGGTIIDMRGSSAPGLFLNGEGLLHLEGVTFTNLGTAHTQPMILTTNTTLHCYGNAFYGHTSKTTSGCDQDAVVIGGTTTTIGSAATSPFQGYGTRIVGCHFNRIKRGVWGRMYANAVKVIENTWWAQCGGSAAIEFDGGGDSVNYNVGGTITGNLIECVGYVRAMAFDFVANFTLVGNDFYDDALIDASGYMLIGDDCEYNTIIAGHYVSSKPLVSQVGFNTIIDPNANATSTFTQPVKFTNDATFTASTQPLATGANGYRSQPAADEADSVSPFSALRSAAAALNPGTTIFDVQQSGVLTLGGDQGGNIDARNKAGTIVASFDGAMRNWRVAGAGGAMEIDSGTGGSYITFKAYGLQLKDQANANLITIKSGAGTPESAFAANPGSIFMRTDGGAGTTMYVKESGTGTTGWVGK